MQWDVERLQHGTNSWKPHIFFQQVQRGMETSLTHELNRSFTLSKTVIKLLLSFSHNLHILYIYI